MSTALDYYVRDEFVINRDTGEAFASMSAAARLIGVPRQTLSDYVTSRKWKLKMGVVPTAAGLRSSRLLNEQQIAECLERYNAYKFSLVVKAGVRLFIYKLAGYEVEVKLQEHKIPQTLPDALRLAADECEKRLLAEARVKELEPKKV